MGRQVADALPLAEIDSRRLLEVFSNLLSNAIKYSAAGARVTFGAWADDGELRVSVKDTGQGMKAEEMPRLFQPFGRLSSKPTGGETSTGLGLSIAKEIVDLHGGRLAVESTLGQGTTFTVHLPLRCPATAHPSPTAPLTGATSHP